MLPANSVRRRFASGGFWVLSGTIAGQMIGAAASIITGRVLGKTGFGELGIVRNTVTMFATLAGLGTGLTANRFTAQLRESDPVRAGRILGLSIVVALASGAFIAAAVLAFAEPLARYTLDAPALAEYIRIGAVLLIFGAWAGVQSGALSGMERFRELSVWSSVSALLAGAFSVAGVLLGGIAGSLWGSVIAALIACLIWHRVFLSHCAELGIRPSYRHSWREHRILIDFALPAVLAGLMVAPVTWAAAAIIANQHDGFGELGLFNAAQGWRNLILFVPGILAQIALPMLSNLQGRGDTRRFVRALGINMGLNAVFCILAAAALAVLSPWLMRAYGREFRAGWLVLVLLAFSAVPQGVVGVIGDAIASLGRMWWGLTLNALWAAELVTTTVLLRHRGAIGLALAYLIAYLLHLVQVGVFTWIAVRRSRSLPMILEPSPQAAPAAEAGIHI